MKSHVLFFITYCTLLFFLFINLQKKHSHLFNLFLTTLWFLWRSRSQVVFGVDIWSSTQVLYMIKAMVRDMHSKDTLYIVDGNISSC